MTVAAPRLFTYSEAAEALNVSERTAYRLAADGHLTRVRVAPNTVRIRADSIAEFIEQGGYSAPSGAEDQPWTPG